MDAFRILRRRLGMLHLVFFGEARVVMTFGAGLRQIQFEYRRGRVFRGSDLVRAVAIPTIGRAGRAHLMAEAVDALRILFLLFLVATAAIRRRQFAGMDEVFDSFVAIHAIQRGVDGFVERIGRKDECDYLAVHLSRRRRVEVAIEAVRTFKGLRGSARKERREKCGEREEHNVPRTADTIDVVTGPLRGSRCRRHPLRHRDV